MMIALRTRRSAALPRRVPKPRLSSFATCSELLVSLIHGDGSWSRACSQRPGYVYAVHLGYLDPRMQISDEEFQRTAASFENPDWAEVTLHSYRVRWGVAPNEPTLAEIGSRLAHHSEISVPTLVIHGGADPCNNSLLPLVRISFSEHPMSASFLRGSATSHNAKLLVKLEVH